jgi:hypothetical protein
LLLAFHQNLEHEKQPDKKQKSNEYFVIPAIENFVCGYVLFIRENHYDHESDKK